MLLPLLLRLPLTDLRLAQALAGSEAETLRVWLKMRRTVRGAAMC